MKNSRNTDLVDRRTAAIDAKKALLETYKTTMKEGEPERLAKLAERAAVAEAREERRLARELIKKQEADRLLAEEAERIAAEVAAANAEKDAREEADRARIRRVIEDEASRKAQRDLRYANRKARNS